MLERKAYQRLVEWKNTSRGKTALMVEGARRVGKSTLVSQFGKQEYRSCLFIDFFQATEEVRQYFRDYRTDLDTLFLYLSTYYGVELYERDTLVVFDEVQMFPEARGLIKYLVADGRFDYIETGSLLSIRQNIQDIVIPSEEESMDLNPMDFEEFLWAMGQRQLADLIRRQFAASRPLPDGLHRRAMGLLREYMLVGGMPDPVSIYVEQRKFASVDASKRRILELYRNDVARFARGYEFKVASVLDGIPGQLSKHEKRFSLSSLGKSARMRDYEESFFWLADARIANLCFACADPSVGLSLSMEQTSLKCYMADTGLLVSLAFADSAATDENVYRAVLRGDIGLNEGMLTENIVAQMLRANGHKLFFYTQSGQKGNEERMEIDFLIIRPYADAAMKPRVSPVEVKSPRQYGTTSLDRFGAKFGKRVGVQYVIHPKQMDVKDGRVYLPLYMAFCL
ncbi:ATPase (AAA+ superfamily) [Bifidobacterium lemurum]|uniref:ATPase (AAA+ superfamily) n=1 Tax=Bifidobacterium lemurum TaxID=1603886 RepID=A0A261FSV3_9BIFI|nr:AAA family ATPase [Bifidobacterium lemurum]OZG62158.1 ATPase (AAA+ superfamily) [Bifidobacterium lemurum]QOL33536.1 ATP-binding protein [Bifidobacterium lemurum]